jgi:hypothetical protein
VSLCGLSFGQCSTLTVTGTVNPGETVAIDVTGATASSLTLLAAGTTAGSTTIMLPGEDLVLGLAQPFVILPIGVTDANGSLSLSVDVPADVPAVPDETLTLQAVTVSFSTGFPPSFTFCVSNTATLVSGNG